MYTKNIIAVFLVIFIIIFSVKIIEFTSTDTIDVQITDKQSIVVKNGDDVDNKYLIFTDKEVFENIDALFKGKLNSSDVQGSLIIGKKYTLEVYGWRIPFLSSYRNITDVKEIK